MISPEEKIDAMNTLAREYAFINSYDAMDLSERALEMSREIGYKTGEAYAMRNLATFYFAREYFYTGSEFIEKSLLLFEELGDQEGKANCYVSLANNYRRQGLIELSLQYDLQALDIFLKLELFDRASVVYHNSASSYAQLGMLELAEDFLEKSKQNTKNYESPAYFSSYLRIRGYVFENRGQFSEAKLLYKRVLEISDSLGDLSQKEAQIKAYLSLSKLLMNEKNYNDAIPLLSACIETSKASSYPKFLSEAYELLVQSYIALSDKEKALASMEMWIQDQKQQNKLWNQDKGILLENARKMIRFRGENEALAYENQLAENRISYQSKMLAILMISVLIVMSLSFFVYRSKKRMSRLYMKLEIQKAEIEEKSLKLEALNQSKNTFFSIVSHDIKSPLNTLSGFMSIFKNYYEHMSKSDMNKLLGDIERSLDNTRQLADNLILWAKSQMNSLEIFPEAFELNPILERNLELIHQGLIEKGIQLENKVSEKILVYADAYAVDFIIRNLLHNALKFTPEGGKIELSAIQQENRCKISVFNTGTGVAPEILESLFLIGKNKSTKGSKGEKGTGLGLVISQDFAVKNDSLIEVENLPGQGVIFSFSLPIAEVIPS